MSNNELSSSWRSAIFSYVLPGLDFWFSGKKYLAFAIFSSVACGAAYGSAQIVSPNGDTALGWTCIVAAFLIWASVVLRPVISSLISRRQKGNVEGSRGKDPFLAMGLSFLIPGFGQFYVRDYAAGSFFILLYLVLRFSTFLPGIGLILILTCGFSSYLASRKATKSREISFKGVTGTLLLLYFSSLAKNGVVYYLGSNIIAENRGHGSSMEPAMFDGDRVLVKVHPLRYERGDVVVLDSPQNGRIAKRLVAFGGEMVEIRDNKVFVNGVSLGADRFAGLQYYSDSTTWFAHENVPYRVPAGKLFVLGDNSHHSYDSRNFGAVPFDQLFGVDYKIIWPISRLGPL